MADREKVINGLRCLSSPYAQDMKWRDCENCQYDNASCFLDITTDALALLKEQEPKPQRYKEHDIFHLPFCPNTVCNAVLDKYWHYCPYCGTKFYWDEELDEQRKAVKWDETD